MPHTVPIVVTGLNLAAKTANDAANAINGLAGSLQSWTVSGTWAGTSTTTGGSFNAPNASTLLTDHTNDAFLRGQPSHCSHHLVPGTFQYQEGKIFAQCPECAEVFTFEAVPGGISYLRIRALVADLLEGDPEKLAEILGEFVALRAMIQAEQAALEEGEELIRIAHQMLAKQLRAAAQ